MHPADTLVTCYLAGAPNIAIAIIPSLFASDLLPSDAPKDVPFFGLEVPFGIPSGVHIHIPFVLFSPFVHNIHAVILYCIYDPFICTDCIQSYSMYMHVYFPACAPVSSSMHTLSCKHDNTLNVYFNCLNIGGYPLVRCIQSTPPPIHVHWGLPSGEYNCVIWFFQNESVTSHK